MHPSHTNTHARTRTHTPPKPHSLRVSGASVRSSSCATLHLQRKGCQRFKMPNRTVSFPYLFFYLVLSRADLPSSMHGPGSFDSYDQYTTENSSIIIAKLLKQPLVNNPVYEEYLHVIVACLLMLALFVLLGLIIRHYGLALPSLTSSQRSKRHQSPAGDTESSRQLNTREGVTGLGFGEMEKAGGGGLDDSELLPEKPRAAHLKWR